jgi:transposase
MKQQTLATAADDGAGFERYRRATRRDVFLATMNEIVPWQALCEVIEPHYPKTGNGRPPVGLERMLRMYFVQHWFNLADEACDEVAPFSRFFVTFRGATRGRCLCRPARQEAVEGGMNMPYLLPGCRVSAVQRDDSASLYLAAHGRQRRGRCPSCGKTSTRLHSRYVRHPADLPSLGCRVRVELEVRRFYCINAACARRTFAERVPELLEPWARRTRRLASAQARVGVALGGQAGARLLPHLGMPASGATLLRMVRRLPLPVAPPPRVVAVDDWALRRGQTYGTIVVDLERRRVVDLLPDRQAQTVSTWLRAQPTLEVVARDRSTEYARGITMALPRAMQVADRWHLLHNVRQMLQRWLQGLHAQLRRLPMAPRAETVPTRTQAYPRTAAERAAGAESRARWRAVYEEVRRRCGQGASLLAISRAMGLARSTVRKFADAVDFPERTVRRPGPTILAGRSVRTKPARPRGATIGAPPSPVR